MLFIRKKLWSIFYDRADAFSFRSDENFESVQQKIERIYLNQGVSFFPDGIRLSWTEQLFEIENYRRTVSNFIRPTLIAQFSEVDSNACLIKTQFILNTLASNLLFGVILVFNLFNLAAMIAAICSGRDTIQLLVAVVLMLFVTNLFLYSLVRIQFWLARRIIKEDLQIILDYMENNFGLKGKVV